MTFRRISYRCDTTAFNKIHSGNASEPSEFKLCTLSVKKKRNAAQYT